MPERHFHIFQIIGFFAPDVRFAVRPSGTEPKIKFYLFARTETASAAPADLPALKAQTSALLDKMASDLERYVQAVVGPASA